MTDNEKSIEDVKQSFTNIAETYQQLHRDIIRLTDELTVDDLTNGVVEHIFSLYSDDKHTRMIFRMDLIDFIVNRVRKVMDLGSSDADVELVNRPYGLTFYFEDGTHIPGTNRQEKSEMMQKILKYKNQGEQEFGYSVVVGRNENRITYDHDKQQYEVLEKNWMSPARKAYDHPGGTYFDDFKPAWYHAIK